MKPEEMKVREKKITRTSLVGILANVALVGAKATIGIVSGSLAILLDAVNNLTDALSSTVTLIGAKIGAKKPDKTHPYGHGRAEYLATMTVGAIVLAAGVISVYQSVRGIIEDPTGKNVPEYILPMLILIGVAVLVKVALGLFFRKRGKALSSEALVGSGTDALLDAILSLSTLVAALISYFAKVSIENYLGAVIGLFIVKAGIELIRQSYSSLIGERATKEDTQALRKKIASYPEVYGVYDILLHNYGPTRSIGSAHIEVDDKMSAAEIHNLTRKIATDVFLENGIILTLGIYSSNDSKPLAKQMKTEITTIAKDYPHILQLHGFYLQEEDKVVSIDMIIDFEDPDPMKTIAEIREKFLALHPDYQFYIVHDLDFAD